MLFLQGKDADKEGGRDKDMKRSTLGRVLKWLGDLCLLASTPQDAVEYYVSAIAECKVKKGGKGGEGRLGAKNPKDEEEREKD